MNNKKIKHALNMALAFSIVSLQSIATADDTDVFLTKKPKPNLMFIMDMSGSMGFEIEPGSPLSRADVMKDAVKSVLKLAPDELNIGVMSYGPGVTSGGYAMPENQRSHGVHGVAFPATGVNELAWPVVGSSAAIDNLPNPSSTVVVRQYLSEIVDQWQPSGGTPIVDSLVEASRYFAGDKVIFGQDIPSSYRGTHPSTHEGSPITLDLTKTSRNPSIAPDYKSPITDRCQENYIALLSDGSPSNYYLNQTKIVRSGWNYFRVVTSEWGKGPGAFASYMKGDGTYGTLASGVGSCESTPSGFKAGRCGPEITQYMATQDMNNDIPGEQNIKVFTVGYGAGIDVDTQNYLKSLVSIEDKPETPERDGYYSAGDAESLSKAFSDIIEMVTESASTMGSPSYSVNVQNGLEHDDATYVPLFSKASGVRWSGNLKKFKLVSNNGVKVLQGKNDRAAFDELGQFKADAIDHWSASDNDSPDGSDLTKGGTASRLVPSKRSLYTNVDCDSGSCKLNTEDNYLVASNDLLVDELFDENCASDKSKKSKKSKKSNKVEECLLAEDSDKSKKSKKSEKSKKSTKDIDLEVDRELLVNFIRGENPDGTTRYHMGDMLHSDPLVITYDAATDAKAKREYIFVGTNEGYLHAFDSTTGEEQFAFMPKQLLKNVIPQYTNLDGAHLYGIDGKISHWQDKLTKKRYLYFGMRRGGSAYFALDITDIKNPKQLWTKSNEDHPTMGQSWSAPYLDRVGVGEDGIKKEAVIISAVYDPAEDRKDDDGLLKNDDPTTNVNTKVGNDILIFDAKTGDKIWSLEDAEGGNKVKASIPGGLKILDTNRNGIVDRIYFADTDGDVWRVDLSEALGSDESKSTLTKLASLGGSGVNHRKFYAEPEVAGLKHKGKSLYVVSIGSGYRAHPMNKVIDDKFFILIDEAPFKDLGEEFKTIGTNDLAKINITAAGSDVALATEGEFYEDGKRGWMVSFPETGEKILTSAVTRNGAVMFTTFVPGNGHVECGNSSDSVSHLYALNVVTGKAGINFNDPNSRQTLDYAPYSGGGGSSPRLPSAGYPGIVPPPELVFGTFEIDEEGNCKHPVDYRWGRKSTPVSGYSACGLEDAYWSNPAEN